MAPRRPDRTTRPGVPHKTPVTPRSNKKGINLRTSTRKTMIRNTETSSDNFESGLADAQDLDDICSDLSSLPTTPRQGIRGVESDLQGPSRSVNTSPKVESDVGALESVVFPEAPTAALRGTDSDTSSPQVLKDTLVGGVAIPATTAFSLLHDQQNPTFTPPGSTPLFQQPHSAPFSRDHKGPSAGVVLWHSPPSGFTLAGSLPVAHRPTEESVVVQPALAETRTPSNPAIAASSPFNSTVDFVPPQSLHCAGERSTAFESHLIVSSPSPNLNRYSSPQYLPSSPQRSTFLTDIRSRTPEYSPPASPPHSRAPSESTIDLCFTLAKRRGSPVLQNSPLPSLSPQYSEDSDPAPSPPSAVIPSPTFPSRKISESLFHTSPERVPVNLATDDRVAPTFPLNLPPVALKSELDNLGFPRPLHAVMRSPNTSPPAILAQPPISFSSPFGVTTPPLDNVTNQDSEKQQEEGRSPPTPARYHKQEEEQDEREDTPVSYIVSETTQGETRSTSGDSFVLSPTSPLLQAPSKVSFVSSSIAFQVALRHNSALPPVSASSTAETHGETDVVDRDRRKGSPTPSARKRDPVTLKTPRGLLKEEVTFYASVRKRRLFRKDEGADSQTQSNLLVRSCAPLPPLIGNEGVTGEPMQVTPYLRRPKVMHVVPDSTPEEDRSTSEPALLEQRRRRRRWFPHVQSSSSAVDSGESEGKDVRDILGSTAAAPIILDSDPETEVDVHPVKSLRVINISSADEAREEKAKPALTSTFYRRRPEESTVPAPTGRFLCVEVPTLRRPRAKEAEALESGWAGAGLGPKAWKLGIASRSRFSPKKLRLLSPSSPSEDELNWDEQGGREEDGGPVTAPDCTQRRQLTHTKRFRHAKSPKSVPPSSRPSFPHHQPKKRKRIDTYSEGDTDELDEWAAEPARPALGHAKRKVALDTETESATDDTMLQPALSIKRPRTVGRGGLVVVQFQCLTPGASFSRPPVEPFRNSVTQANASINISTIRAPKFTSRAPGCSFGCHNCRSNTDRNIKIRCSNSDRDTGQCMHHWCERCLVLWYGFDGRALLSAYAFSGEELGPLEIKALGERGTDGGVGIGLGVIPGKWICPHCLGKCMCTYCTRKDGRSRSRFRNDTTGIPLDLEGLDGLEGAPGLRGIRPKERKKPSVSPATPSLTQSITPSLVSVAGLSTQNGESLSSTSGPLACRRPRITRELQDLLTPEFGHGIHVNGHGELEIYKQDAAGNVVCVGVPTRMRTRACPDGAPESMGGVGVSATELYKPVFLPGERERWRQEVGLGEESAGSDSEVDADRSVLKEVEHGPVEESEGLPRRANFVNVPWGAKLPQAQKRLNMTVQATPENEGEGGNPPNDAQPSKDGVEGSRNLGHYVEPVVPRSQFDISSLLNFDAEAETGTGNVDGQGERRLTNMEDLDTALYPMEPYAQVPSMSIVAPALPHPALDITAAPEWGGWETIALEFGDPSFSPLPSCGPLTMDGASTVPTGAHDAPSETVDR